MTRHLTLTIGLALLVPGLSSGCGGDDPPPLFASLVWQVLCDIDGGCTSLPVRDVNGGDGTNGVSLTCGVTPIAGGQALNFTARGPGNEFLLRIQNAAFPVGGGPVFANSCEIAVIEGGNNYTGRCGAAQPSDACAERPEDRTSECVQPCRLYELETTVNDAGTPVINALLYCQGLVLTADALRSVELTNGNAGADGEMPSSDPVAIRIEGCPGL